MPKKARKVFLKVKRVTNKAMSKLCRVARKFRLNRRQNRVLRRVAKLIRSKKYVLATRLAKRLPCGVRKMIKKAQIRIRYAAKKCPK
jgi:DNA-binding transcriptional MocR family regulator